MLTIYGVHRSRASRNIWLAHELGIPFKLAPVMQLYRLKEPDSRRPCPHQVAVLPEDQSQWPCPVDRRRWAGAARIARHQPLPRQEAWRPAGASQRRRGRADEHVVAVGGDRSRAAFAVDRPERPVRRPRSPTLARARSPCSTRRCASGFLVGGRFTVADINVAEVVRYAAGCPEPVRSGPQGEGVACRLPGAPGFKKMWDAREKEPT